MNINMYLLINKPINANNKVKKAQRMFKFDRADLRRRQLGATVHLPLTHMIVLVPWRTNPGWQAYWIVLPESIPCPLETWGIGGQAAV